MCRYIREVIFFTVVTMQIQPKAAKNVYKLIFLLQARFNSQTPQTGFFKEWTLMLHGTREPPYTELSVLDPHSKLAIVKKAHEGRNKLY